MRVTKNYTDNGGNKTVIGGALEIKPGANITGLPKATAQANSKATDVAGLVADFNSLLAKLKTSGLMASK